MGVIKLHQATQEFCCTLLIAVRDQVEKIRKECDDSCKFHSIVPASTMLLRLTIACSVYFARQRDACTTVPYGASDMAVDTDKGPVLLRQLVCSSQVLRQQLHKLTFLPESAPGVTIDGFNNMPSNSTLLSARYLKVWAQISSATSAVLQTGVVVYELLPAKICNSKRRMSNPWY